ncbi:regulator of chromosome condensation 1/beta-lactamase-inhibitor protein II [Lipomyces oligophaga]|uniref:regulator of chromosome condensation 1/beta-lactamase-inhibitor protein II n=1 Tax=Lipomyces oligophaga TaxID=45792 RepID=UPI0034CFB6DB
MAPPRKRKELHDSEGIAATMKTSKRQTKAAPPVKRVTKTPSSAKSSAGVRRARKAGSIASSVSSTNTIASRSTKSDSIGTEITEPDEDVKQETQVDEDSLAETQAKVEYEAPYKLKKPTGKIINQIPQLKTVPLNIYVFGTGSMSELGLGPEAKNKEVKRPRLNPFLPIDSVSIVDFAVGGAHVVVIDKAGKLWSWGCNDHGALGRNTAGGDEGLLRDMDAEDDDDDGDLNPYESTPAKVENLPDDLVFVEVAASDSLSVGLTSEGRVWAWGTFRCNEGILGFSEKVEFQRTPTQIPLPFAVTSIVAGKDHVLALTVNGKVFAWGNGQQFQLGRRIMDREKMQSLIPREFGIKNIKSIGSGEYHSFAIDTSGRVMAWGLNQFGQCGIPSDAGEDGAVVSSPTYIDGLDGKNIVCITGGEHHSAALSAASEMYTFGRVDSFEVGIEKDELPETAVKDANGKPRYLPIPTIVTIDDGDVHAKFVACGSHHNIALAKEDGSAWTWGFGETYQVGQGPSGEDVEIPTKIENTATKGVEMILAGAGGQFSVLGGRSAVVKDESTSI